MHGTARTGTQEAETVACGLLVGVGTRWSHTLGVVTAAHCAAAGLADPDSQALMHAAWLHDIGYAPQAAHTGFHSLDGARELLARGFPPRLAALVAHHSLAAFEARVRGLEPELAEFPLEVGPVPDALTWADMTTDPDGQPTSVDNRITEILERYPQSHPVHAAISAAAADITAAVRRTEQRMAALVC